MLSQFGTMKLGPTITSVPSSLVVGGQSTWDDETNSLYYVDLFGSRFCRYSVDENTVYKTTLGQIGTYGFITPIKGKKNRFLVSVDENVFILKWDGRSSNATKGRTLFTVNPRMNVNSVLITADNELFLGGFTDSVCGNPANLWNSGSRSWKRLLTVSVWPLGWRWMKRQIHCINWIHVTRR